MQHVAIMKKSWGLLPKIVSGEKSIESRWYESRRTPWNRISAGDTIFFKNSGEPVTVKSRAKKVLYYSGLEPKDVRDILRRYGKKDGIAKSDTKVFYERFKNKKYCILVFLDKPHLVSPFNIDKAGFGTMSAWLTAKKFKAKNLWTESFEW